jgi:hypothetical protein
MTTSFCLVLFSLVETVNSKLELYGIQWYENPMWVFRNSTSSDGELSAIGKKEWEKRLKVRRTRVSDPEPDPDLIWIQLGQWILSRQAKIISR